MVVVWESRGRKREILSKFDVGDRLGGSFDWSIIFGDILGINFSTVYVSYLEKISYLESVWTFKDRRGRRRLARENFDGGKICR